MFEFTFMHPLKSDVPSKLKKKVSSGLKEPATGVEVREVRSGDKVRKC